MLQNSITVSVLRRLWHLLRESAFYGALLYAVEFVAEGYKKSTFRKCILAFGNLSAYVEDSVFYRIFSRIFSFFGKLFLSAADKLLTQSKGGLTERFYHGALSSSVLFGYNRFFPLLAAVIFLVPHDLWNNFYALLLSVVMLALYFFSLAVEGQRQRERTGAPAAVDFSAAARRIPISILFFIFSVLLAVVVSADRADSIRVLFFFIASFLMCFSVYGRLSSREVRENFMQVVYFTLLLMSVFAVVQRILGVEADASLTDLSLNENMPGRVFGTMDNPNNLAEYLTIFIPFGFAYALTRRSREEKALHLLFMLLPLGAILLTYSRSGWIALAVAAVVFVALYQYRLFPAALVGVIFALPFIPRSIYDRILTIGNMHDTSSSYRIEIWKGCLRMLKDYWFTGVGLGPGAFADVFPWYALGETTVVMHSHMQFMEMAVEGGILLFIAYIALVFGTVRRACRAVFTARSEKTRLYAVASAASLSGITLIGLFEYCWFYPRVMFAFFISVGMCLAVSKAAEDERDAQKDGRKETA